MAAAHTFVVLAYRESPYLEECVRSVLAQTVRTNVVMATSTPNDHIKGVAKKYGLDVKINGRRRGIAYDFDFALCAAKSRLVTIAHQDDVYEPEYADEILSAYDAEPGASILFTKYYEIKGESREYANRNLRIKRTLLLPLRLRRLSGSRLVKRMVLRFGNPIGCPSVTFATDKCPEDLFASDMKSDMDWLAWERLSGMDGKFIYITKTLMGHRIHEGSATSAVLRDNVRAREDFYMFTRFWPRWMAKILARLYSESEKGNRT